VRQLPPIGAHARFTADIGATLHLRQLSGAVGRAVPLTAVGQRREANRVIFVTSTLRWYSREARVSAEPRLRSIVAALLLFFGVAILLVAVALAVWTNEGWPRLTLTAFALLVVGALLIARDLGIPS
jgi:hypothetical protein